MQGCGPGISSIWARRVATINGTTDPRILKRNMTRNSLAEPVTRRAYGWRSVNKTRYRRVDITTVHATVPPRTDAHAVHMVASRVSRRKLSAGILSQEMCILPGTKY